MRFARKLDYETMISLLGATVIDLILLIDFLKLYTCKIVLSLITELRVTKYSYCNKEIHRKKMVSFIYQMKQNDFSWLIQEIHMMGFRKRSMSFMGTRKLKCGCLSPLCSPCCLLLIPCCAPDQSQVLIPKANIYWGLAMCHALL